MSARKSCRLIKKPTKLNEDVYELHATKSEVRILVQQ